jgi:hypothetical protein
MPGSNLGTLPRRLGAAILVALMAASAGAQETMSSGWVWPTGSSDINNYLGWLGYNSPSYPYHLAKDMANPVGDAVYAIGDGEILASRTDVGGYGPNYTPGGAVIIRHQAADGTWFTALYGHLDSPRGVGAVVAGEVIGNSNAWNPGHVHFGIHVGYDLEATNPWRGYTHDTGVTYGFTDPLPFLQAHPRGASLHVTGDWNGDGQSAVWGFIGGQWTIPASDAWGTPVQFTMGLPGDLPVVGDWDGNGVVNYGVFRPNVSPSTFFLDVDRIGGADWTVPLAGFYPQDIPVAGDWDGDGDDDIGAYNPLNGTFYLALIDEVTHVRQDLAPFVFQGWQPNDLPLAGKWDGGIRDDVGLFRAHSPNPNTNDFIVRHAGSYYSFAAITGDGYGNSVDIPLIADWDQSGYDSIGVYRQADGQAHWRDPAWPKIGSGPVPTLRVTSPNGGETLTAGATWTAQWTAQNLSPQATVGLWLFNMGTQQFTWIADVPSGQTSYVFTVPGPAAAQASLYIWSRVGGATEADDWSDQPFAVTGAAPVPTLRITSPNGGETLTVGSNWTAQWTAQYLSPQATVGLWLWHAGTQQFTWIADVPSGQTAYVFTVPGVPPGQATLYIWSRVGGSTEADDWSDQAFTLTTNDPIFQDGFE